ncbi:AlpA family transcriptional regulator [Pseudoalteromonas sp. bablab_jr011]|uniref:helix-turn-helix transcriptional regulator n=1 Tax=Pseudoalteromonas sp. bablab_jr011 TaxID=2755062 RepID=UPI0018F2ADE1|nr:helix-turn-helix domain-containing protein [Pseudoalteromonas sp. bablab_jr011]
MNFTNTNDNLRLKDAAAYIGVSKPTLWRLAEQDPTFPKKIRISSRCCIYRRSDLQSWLASKEI